MHMAVFTLQDAEAMLRSNMSEGHFLVRESTSNPGDYTLSVVFQRDVVHVK
jgi:hypothetical protein